MSMQPGLMIIAGEPSADAMAAPIYKRLKQQHPDLSIHGIGGSHLKAEGLSSLFPMSELSLMGLIEIIPSLPNIFKRLKFLEEFALKNNIKTLLTIDTQEFSYHLAKRLAPHGIRCVQLVAPTVWAWRAGRAPKYAKVFEEILSIYPFEALYFTRFGGKVTYVGNPVAERLKNLSVNAPAEPPIPMKMAILPGSRAGEWQRLLPIFTNTLLRLRLQRGKLQVVVPIADESQRAWAKPLTDLGNVKVISGPERLHALQQCRSALVASGTANLELAMLGVPMVVGYRVNSTTAFLGKKLLKVPYISPVNWVANEAIVPELVQQACTATALTAAMQPLLNTTAAWHEQSENLAQIRHKLNIEQSVTANISQALSAYL